jgi:hypothetical protein
MNIWTAGRRGLRNTIHRLLGNKRLRIQGLLGKEWLEEFMESLRKEWLEYIGPWSGVAGVDSRGGQGVWRIGISDLTLDSRGLQRERFS